MRIMQGIRAGAFLCSLCPFLSVEAIPRSHVFVHGVVSQWVGADAASYGRWRRLEATHEIVGDEGGGLPVPTARGAVLYVPGWAPGAARQENAPQRLSDVYYSGNAPYRNEPPSTALRRRTMLDLLWKNDRQDIVAFTYGWKICDLLENHDTLDVPAAQKNKAHVLALVKEAQQLFGVDLGAYFKWEVSWDAARRQFYDSDGNAQNAAFVFSTLYQYCDFLRNDLDDLVLYYEEGLKAYREDVGLPWGAKDYATHSEVMFLYDVWQAGGGQAGGRRPRRLLYELEGLLTRVGLPAAPVLIISKPMCDNCEPWIVRAWIGGAAPLSVVSEKAPGNAITRNATVQKVDVPARNRAPWLGPPEPAEATVTHKRFNSF